MKRTILVACLVVGLLAGIGTYFLHPQPKPEHAWLVFGPDATVRVLVSLHGEAVTLDHYLDGKPTGRQERFPDRLECKDVTIADPDGKTTYTIAGMSGTVVREGVPTELFTDVDIQGPASYRQYCDLMMTDNPETARLSHFHGPLVIEAQGLNGKLPPDLSLQRGDKPTELRVNISTMNAEKGCWVVICTQDDKRQPVFRNEVHPFVDVEFPPRQAGGPPITRRYSLDHVCCGSIFHGPVRVPAEAGKGKAKLTFSFAAWKEGKVASSTIELPIVESPTVATGGY